MGQAEPCLLLACVDNAGWSCGCHYGREPRVSGRPEPVMSPGAAGWGDMGLEFGRSPNSRRQDACGRPCLHP